MLGWLRLVFGKHASNEVLSSPITARPSGFQLASSLDEQFVFDAILAEAMQGHFNADYLIAHLGLRHQIQTSIASRQCPAHHGRVVESSIYVFVEDSFPIGFSWVLASEKKEERELYLLAVSPSHRGRGIGRDLVSMSISQFPPKTKFVARLRPASELMLQILLRMGFRRNIKQGKKITDLSFVSR